MVSNGLRRFGPRMGLRNGESGRLAAFNLRPGHTERNSRQQHE